MCLEAGDAMVAVHVTPLASVCTLTSGCSRSDFEGGGDFNRLLFALDLQVIYGGGLAYFRMCMFMWFCLAGTSDENQARGQAYLPRVCREVLLFHL